MVALRGDFHVHPLGHGPLPESAAELNFHGPDPELPRAPLSLERSRAKVRAMLHAAVAKGLDFMANTDHEANTSRLAFEVVEEERLPLVVIPGFEAAPISADPSLNHVLVVGVPPAPGQAVTGVSLGALRALADRHGGLLVAAHPERKWFFRRGLAMGAWDAVEVTNCGTGRRYPPRSNLPRLSNSDAHSPRALLERDCVTVVEAEANTQAAILDAVRRGRVAPHGGVRT